MLTLSRTKLETINTPYQAAPHIRYRNIEGRVVVLDLRNGQYLIFDEVASFIWETLLSISNYEKCLSHVTEHFKISLAQCEQDINDFIESCIRRGLFINESVRLPDKSPVMMRHNAPNIFNAWKCLYLTRRSLKQAGFSVTYDLHMRMRKPETLATQDVGKILSKAVGAFQFAENFFSTKDVGIDCLPRSLALHRFLISIGIEATHCIGARCYPFGAHAWVEVKGIPVCDTVSFISKYNEISRV